MTHEIGAHVHIVVNGRIINAIVTEHLLGGGVLVMTDSTGGGRYTRPAHEVNRGWLMLGSDARSLDLAGGAS